MKGTDIVVAGAGVVGLSAAKFLALRGAKVTVLDPQTPGGLGSRAAAGVAIPSFRLLEDRPLLRFTTEAKTVLAQEIQSISDGAIRRGRGILRIAADAATKALMEAKSQDVPGWLGQWVPGEALGELEPALEGSSIFGAFLQDDAHLVDTDVYLNGLLSQLAAAKVSIRLGEGIQEARETADKVHVRTSRGILVVDQLIVAAGAWSGSIPGLPPLPIKPVRGQMITVFHPTVRLTRVVSGPSYLAPWRRGEIVVGATEEDAGFLQHPTPAGILHLSAVLARLSPVLREAQFVRAWAGLRSYVGQGRPWIGKYPGLQRTLIGTGHAGQGILTGGLTGQLLADLAEGKTPELASAFTPPADATSKNQ